MKQLVILLLISVTTLSVSAQRNHRDNDRDYRRVDRYNDKRDRFDNREKEAYRRQLEKINHQYDSRISKVMRSPFIGRNAKNRKINQLENDRRIALNECRARFYRQMDYADRNRRDDRRDDRRDNNRRDKW